MDSYDDESPIEIIDDRFTLRPVSVIARGGMGVVYEADMLGCEGFSKRVAVKTLRTKWSENRKFVDLLNAEAKLVAGLVHENIAQMYLLGALEDGRRYVVMEYVQGMSLMQMMIRLWHKMKLLPEPLSVHIVSRIARGLGYAHNYCDRTGERLGIVHRDVCPSNILITTEGLAKLIDFGVAKAATMTIIGDNWQTGKIAYMSPEQANRKPVDSRSDIYALGAVLFELLAGRPMRNVEKEGSPEDLSSQPVPWKYVEDQAGEDLVAILRQMLDPNPIKRFDSANDAARALEEYIYRDGYGPTIQTVEAYMRENFPDLYDYGSSLDELPEQKNPTVTRAADDD